jgi:putative sigma-54 modulation protein
MSVRVEINVHNLELSERLREYVTKKAAKLDRYLDILEEADVDLRYVQSARSANDRQIAQLTVRGRGVILRAEERTDDIFASFDTVVDKITRQIERYKGKRWRGRGDGRSAADFASDLASEYQEDEEEEPQIVRRKRFLLTPMDEREAIEQMRLLDHEDFFIFLNVNTNLVNVIYRRRDGSFGLIEAQVG